MCKKIITFDQMIKSFREAIQDFPDNRTGKNSFYSMEDAALGAFSVFFTQCPSFLAHQKAMEESRGKSNAQTLFGIEKIPTDNHIRTLLDTPLPELVFPVFERCREALIDSGHLDEFRIFNGDLLIVLDGTQYFSSKTIHCETCSTKRHKDGSITYSHSVVTPVIVAPGKDKAIPLEPEFIVPQDGHDKQDCENAAAKRWLDTHGKKYSDMGATASGDDLYCKQPLCEKFLDKGFNFILVCKPDSHKTLYEWVEGLEEGVGRHTFIIRRWNGRSRETYTYRYANDVPLRDGDDALLVNWCELILTTDEGEILYQNGFVTKHKVTNKNVEAIIECGRARWKVENENNNTLKTKGYHLEHNYGHGKKNLSSLLVTFILLAFLFHTLLDFMDGRYRLIRKKLPSRKTFFDDMRALMRYICFESWDALMSFMMEGLNVKLEPG